MGRELPYDCQKVGLHQFEHQVQVLLVGCTQHPVQGNHVRVLDPLQDLDLTVRALRVDVVAESTEHLLESIGLARKLVLHPPNVAVSPATDQLAHSVTLQDVLFYFFGHLNIMGARL